ncbi:hypothetical protein KDL01_01460 [Actinospica durhamensis]|uniref:Uncharacterized protein n=1 Tax=Actinospica durhamensis TaxID=1508375 RepID=A0A941EIL6_9ACTN|nr:hypothetical protein [Actinospica durhamensis]MBR7831906.1 hypothetical protein [Actinospica durhamensis]
MGSIEYGSVTEVAPALSVLNSMVDTMGNLFQTLVDLDATPAEAADLASRGLDWLVREAIVSAERTNCVLGAPLGNPPGQSWAKAVADPDWEPTDGLNIAIGRTVFYGGQGGARYATCPRCAARVWFYTESWKPIAGPDDPFFAAIDVWYETGEANVTCPSCEQASDLVSWQWADDYFAFGYLGFEFWNWPEFAARFVEDLAQVLDGHRLIRVWGKL